MCVLDKNNLFICGGQNGQVQPFQVYMGSEELEEMTAVLDTATWTWRIPKLSYLNQPYPQSYATLALVNTTKLVFGFGKFFFFLKRNSFIHLYKKKRYQLSYGTR